MNPLNMLFGQVANAIMNHASPNTPGPSYDANPLLGQLSGLFGQAANQHGMPFDQNQQYGGGGNQYGNVQSASQDPYGDPADNGGFGNVQSASQDPYGDPADQR